MRKTRGVVVPFVSKGGVLVREETLTGLKHPDPLHISDSGRSLTLIVDPIADVLRKGDPTLLWEGDERLAMYFDAKGGTYELWRLEADNEYRCFIRLAAAVFKGPEAVAEMIVRFKAGDSRRGVDLYEMVKAQNLAVDRERERVATERNVEFAERLRHALIRDGVE